MKTDRKPEPVPFADFVAGASRLFEEAETDPAGVLVEYDGTVFSVHIRRKAPQRRFTERDSIFNLEGIGHSEEPTNVGEQKDAYLADAYADTHEP
jgi:hypothetical protein